MTEPPQNLSAYARLLGFLYLFSMALFVGYFAIVSGLTVEGDFAASSRNIADSELPYRAALAALLLGSATVFGIGWAFYVLLRPVHPELALLALLFRAAEGTLVGVGALIRFTALENYLGARDAGAASLLGETLLGGYQASFFVGQLFLSLGSTLFFYLLLKSRFVPRLLAAFGLAASALLGLQTLAHLLVPEAAAALGFAEYAPMFATEIGTGLWLLIKGVNPVGKTTPESTAALPLPEAHRRARRRRPEGGDPADQRR